MGVSQLGYIGIQVPNLDEWRTYATSVLGLEVREPAGPGAPMYLRVDDQHHRLALYPGKEEKLIGIGWEVPTRAGLHDLAKRLQGKGVAVREGTKDEAAARKVAQFYAFKDPHGFPVEIYYGPTMEDAPFRPGRAHRGFNCGGLGLGHVVIICKDQHAAAEWYINELGFKLSDYIAWDDADAVFLHCNPRHHSLAMINECYGMQSGQMHHIMLESLSLDDVGRAYDTVVENKLPLIMTLGRHSNDHMTSFYMKTPSSFAIEYGWGGRLIDDSVWRVQKYGSPKIWGHQLVM